MGKRLHREEKRLLWGAGRLFEQIPMANRAMTAVNRWIRTRPFYCWRNLRAHLADPTNHHGPVGKGARILVINHFFDQDLESILEANRDHRILVLHYLLLRRIAMRIFPTRLQNDWLYTNPDTAEYRRAYRAEMDRVVETIRQSFPFDVAIAPSDFFFWIRDFVQAVQSQGVPFVVVDKEGTTSPYAQKGLARQIPEKFPLISDHLLAWSERQKRFWTLTGVPDSAITVVGQQRSDFWSRRDKWPAKSDMGLPLRRDAPLFVLFSFFPGAYIPLDVFKQGIVSWESLFRESHRVALEVAREFPEWDVVIKAHPQQTNLPELRALIAEFALPNVHLATGAQLSNPLIVHGDVISSFVTTALIEAMIPRQQPIVFCYWGDAKEKWSEEIVPFHKSGAVTVAESPEEYRDRLREALRDPASAIPAEQLERRKDFVNEYFHNPDGHVAERTLAKLAEIARRGRERTEIGPYRITPPDSTSPGSSSSSS